MMILSPCVTVLSPFVLQICLPRWHKMKPQPLCFLSLFALGDVHAFSNSSVRRQAHGHALASASGRSNIMEGLSNSVAKTGRLIIPRIEPQEDSFTSICDYFRPQFAIRELLLGAKIGFRFVSTQLAMTLLCKFFLAFSPSLLLSATQSRVYPSPLSKIGTLRSAAFSSLTSLSLIHQRILEQILGSPVFEEIGYRSIGWLVTYYLSGLHLWMASLRQNVDTIGVLFYAFAHLCVFFSDSSVPDILETILGVMAFNLILTRDRSQQPFLRRKNPRLLKVKESPDESKSPSHDPIRFWYTALMTTSWFARDHGLHGLLRYFTLGASTMLVEVRLLLLRRNLWPCIGAHMAHNILAVLLGNGDGPRRQRTPKEYLVGGLLAYPMIWALGFLLARAVEGVEAKMDRNEE